MKNLKNLIILACFLSFNYSLLAQDGLILPMPGMKPNNQNSSNQNKSSEQKQQNKQLTNTQKTNQNTNTGRNNKNTNVDSSGAILPLPSMNNKGKTEEKTAAPKSSNTNAPKPKTNSDSQSEPLIALPASQKTQTTTIQTPQTTKSNNSTSRPKPTNSSEIPSSNKTKTIIETPKPSKNDDSDFFNNDSEFPDLPDEIGESAEESLVEEILPPAESETTVTEGASGEKIVVFPKDTGAAIFMVMKSWQCEDYDSVSLINQALEVYGKDAGEEYKIQGLENIAKGVKVSVEEEDITFDELLDIIASKTGNDWGCDIANKTVIIYPKGIKTESYLTWEEE